MDPGNTNNLLQLARRLHEEHVREGVEKRDALIAEGHATAARVVADAESKQRASLGALEQERQQLEGRIDELRTFEREYREKLKGYIEGQLRELDSAGNVLPATPAAVTSGTSSPFAEVTAASTSATFADAPAPTYNESPAPTFGEAPQYAAPQPPANFPGFGTS
jgi:TolA-binding protein